MTEGVELADVGNLHANRVNGHGTWVTVAFGAL